MGPSRLDFLYCKGHAKTQTLSNTTGERCQSFNPHEKHGLEMEIGFFVTQNLLIKVPNAHTQTELDNVHHFL